MRGTPFVHRRYCFEGTGTVPRHMRKETVMRALGLWLLGVPLWLVIMLALFTDWV